MYELCLEYGSYPVKMRDGFLVERTSAPEFLADNPTLLAKIEDMNRLFHELFLTIECTFHYVGSQYPEKIKTIKALYEEVATELTTTYADQNITVEYFIL